MSLKARVEMLHSKLNDVRAALKVCERELKKIEDIRCLNKVLAKQIEENGKDEGEMPRGELSWFCTFCGKQLKSQDGHCCCEGQYEYHKWVAELHKPPLPDTTPPKPLNAEVHEALGHKVWCSPGSTWKDFCPTDECEPSIIPNYADSDKLADKAGNEYLDKIQVGIYYPFFRTEDFSDCSGQIELFFFKGNEDSLKIVFGRTCKYSTRAAAKCALIVSHAKKMREGK